MFLCANVTYFDSMPLIQPFHYNSILFKKGNIHIFNILQDEEMCMFIKILQKPYLYISKIPYNIDANIYTNDLLNQYVAIHMINYKMNIETEKEKIWTIDNEYNMWRMIKYFQYLSNDKLNVNLLNNNSEKLNVLLQMISTHAIPLHVQNLNFLNNAFVSNLLKTIGIPSHIINTIDGRSLYIYHGIIVNATISFYLQIDKNGNPISYCYILKCTEKNIQNLIFDDPSMLIEYKNQIYKSFDKYEKGEYTIYVSRYFEISQGD